MKSRLTIPIKCCYNTEYLMTRGHLSFNVCYPAGVPPTLQFHSIGCSAMQATCLSMSVTLQVFQRHSSSTVLAAAQRRPLVAECLLPCRCTNGTPIPQYWLQRNAGHLSLNVSCLCYPAVVPLTPQFHSIGCSAMQSALSATVMSCCKLWTNRRC
jgi:hypothetical protein